MRLRTLLICLLALLIACAGLASFVTSAQIESNNNASNEKASPSGAAFVVYINAQGEAICRAATPSERRQIMQRSGESRVIYDGAPRRNVTSGNKFGPNAQRATIPNVQPSAGLRIVLHGTAQLDQNQTAKNAFIAAANHWEALISTPITVVLDVDFGSTFFGTPYPNANIIGATATAQGTRLYSDVRDRLLANSPTAAESQLYNALPVGSVPTELSNTAFKTLTVRLSRANERALGFVADIADPNVLPIGGGDAGIGFNSAFPFDFDPSNGIDSNKVDFDAAATHEIGHALGFTSESGGPVYAPTSIWDMLRFRPSAATIGTLATAPRIMSAGGTQVYFNGQTNTFGSQELGLSTGGPSGSAGDGSQSSHWKDDHITFQYIGIMDPSIGFGQRNQITDNDIKTIDSFGYSIGSPVPGPPSPPAAPPPPPNDNFANATVIQGVADATTGNSTGATTEPGEPVMLPGNGAGGKSVWYRWTSPATGTATFDTEGSGFDTMLAVSTGNSVGSLSRLSVNDDLATGQTTSSRVTFSATAGVTYQLTVDGFDNGEGPESGLIEINWSVTGASPSPSPTPSPSPGGCTAGNRTQDPGFEASTGTAPITNPFWPSTSTQFDTSLCSVAECGSAGGTAVPRNGTYWVWFGGTDGPETGTVRQTVTFPSGGTATLNYYLRIGVVNAPFTDVMNVKVDGTIVQSFTEPSVAEANYTLRTVNLNAYADGAQHTILFEYISPSGGAAANFNVDDVTLDVVCPVLPTLQFNASNFDVGEGDGHATITVTRSGDTSGASTVDFATSNGTASQRSDYIVRVGTLTFGAGVTSRTFSVPLIDDVYAEANETINLSLSNPVGAVVAAPSTATITIADNDAAGPSIAQKRFGASFGGAEETPPNASLGSGQGYVLLNAAETAANVSLQFLNLGSAETAAHIHGPVPAGTPGPIIFPLNTTNPVVDQAISPMPQNVADLKAGLHYINVHSNNFPNGEIRGQLLWNPTMEGAFFARQHYLDFLGREPDASGLQFWIDRLNLNCVSGSQCFHDNTIGVSDAFFFEPEFHQTAGFVFLVYRAAYGNTQPFHNPDGSNPAEANKLPEYGVFTADRARVVGGANLSASQLAFANLFVTRAEFTSKYGAGLNTGALFVDAVLATIQQDDGVNLTSQRQALIDQYNNAGGGNGGRAQVLYLLALDDSVNNPINNRAYINIEYNRQFALTLYFGYLRRNPDIAGFLFWQGQINLAPVGDVPKQQALVCSFVTAPEYEFRFGPNAPRNNRECPQ